MCICLSYVCMYAYTSMIFNKAADFHGAQHRGIYVCIHAYVYEYINIIYVYAKYIYAYICVYKNIINVYA